MPQIAAKLLPESRGNGVLARPGAESVANSGDMTSLPVAPSPGGLGRPGHLAFGPQSDARGEKRCVLGPWATPIGGQETGRAISSFPELARCGPQNGFWALDIAALGSKVSFRGMGRSSTEVDFSGSASLKPYCTRKWSSSQIAPDAQRGPGI